MPRQARSMTSWATFLGLGAIAQHPQQHREQAIGVRAGQLLERVHVPGAGTGHQARSCPGRPGRRWLAGRAITRPPRARGSPSWLAAPRRGRRSRAGARTVSRALDAGISRKQGRASPDGRGCSPAQSSALALQAAAGGGDRSPSA